MRDSIKKTIPKENSHEDIVLFHQWKDFLIQRKSVDFHRIDQIKDQLKRISTYLSNEFDRIQRISEVFHT